MAVHWVVVADAGSAHVYEGEVLLEELHAVPNVTFTHQTGTGHGGREAHHDPHLLNEGRFARAVAHAINEGLTQHRFERLVLVAPPHFLGDLRAELSTLAARAVVGSIHHDWTKVQPHMLAARVRKELPAVFGLD